MYFGFLKAARLVLCEGVRRNAGCPIRVDVACVDVTDLAVARGFRHFDELVRSG
jgi:hypothetical protein